MKFDEIGYWSELKLDIVKNYANEYSKIISSQRKFKHGYIDAFAGAGRHRRKGTEDWVPGSPLNALNVDPPFKEYWFVDLEPGKIEHLRRLIPQRRDVHIRQGDCNEILLRDIFPRFQYRKFGRALCLIDPYGLHLDWEVLRNAGSEKSIEIFLNFPVMDMNMNVLWRNPERVTPDQRQRMTRYWGDESWQDAAYSTAGNFFGYQEKVENADIAEAFRERLQSVAGFAYVPKPIPMRNDRGAIVYFLFFASPNVVADRIVKHIFDKYRDFRRT